MIRDEENEDEYSDIEVPAQVVNGVTLVPLRFIAKSMCADVNYEKSTITITYEGEILKLTIGEKTVTQNGKVMDVNFCYVTSSYYNAWDTSGNELFKYEIYQLLNNYEALELLEWLLHDVKTDKWYHYEGPREDIGLWKQIYNNAI